MSDLRDLMRDAGTAPAGSATMTAQYAAVRHRIKRRRAVRATGIGSAAAVSAGAMALGVAHVLPGKPQEAGPASAVEASASTEPEASSAPSVAPSTVLDVPVASPSPSVDPGNVHQLDAPAGMLYSVQDDATGELLSALVAGDEPGTAVLTSADGPPALLEVTSAGTFVFSDEVGGQTVWVTVTPKPDGSSDSIEVVHGGPQPEGEFSVRTPLD
ncbi:hypothetical protein [Demequina globuliformis]|uniref:hypothetical protein n=1 Tax=Demequina globuliformis TaxID=676202 RepID=UPI000785252F|nr:hypothetical protein [Demequina globuliformis]